MALRKILQGDDAALTKVARPVTTFDKRLHTLLDDMRETMYEAEGAGLAANQVGILRRAVVIDCGEGLIELVNPEILETQGEQGGMEGCLSFPGQAGYVLRPNRVLARAQDRYGVWKQYDVTGFCARAFLHETDHLEGKVFLGLVTEPPEGYEEEEESEA